MTTTTKPTGGPAFPTSIAQGQTLRDWFAGQAMAAMLVNHKWNCDELAEHAYRAADAMIAERAKT